MATKKELEFSFLYHCQTKNIPIRPDGSRWKNTIIYRCTYCKTQLEIGEERCPNCKQKYKWNGKETNEWK